MHQNNPMSSADTCAPVRAASEVLASLQQTPGLVARSGPGTTHAVHDRRHLYKCFDPVLQIGFFPSDDDRTLDVKPVFSSSFSDLVICHDSLVLACFTLVYTPMSRIEPAPFHLRAELGVSLALEDTLCNQSCYIHAPLVSHEPADHYCGVRSPLKDR